MAKTKTRPADMARVLYEELIGTALQQLQNISHQLEGTSGKDASVKQKVEDAISPDTSPQVRNFVLTLAKEGHIGDIAAIARAFEHYAQAEEQDLHVEVISAIPLEAEQQQQIISELRQQYNQQMEPQFHVDESIIGGLIVRVGDQVFDNSLRSRLSVVQRNMLVS